MQKSSAPHNNNSAVVHLNDANKKSKPVDQAAFKAANNFMSELKYFVCGMSRLMHTRDSNE